MEKVSLVDKFNNEEFLGRVNEDSLDRKLLNSFGRQEVDSRDEVMHSGMSDW